MVMITLPDGNKIEIENGKSAYDVALKISTGLAKACIGAKLDDKLVDLHAPITKDAKLVLIKPQTPEGLDIIRHSTSHLMAQAILRIYPDAKLTIGPVVENGFYYDIEHKSAFVESDLQKIEEEMKRIVDEDQPFVAIEVSKKQALELYSDNIFKREIINQLEDSESIKIYYNKKTQKSPNDAKEFFDLCTGPHVPSTGVLKAFKLLKVAGAYWRADAKNEQLQRVYGVAFATKKELDDYIQKLEQASKRDHRKLAKELNLVMFSEMAPGMVFFLPNATIIRRELENFLRVEQNKRGYVEIQTPIIYNNKMWHTSGHWDHYKDNMYFTKIDEQDYAVKPMNCPGHMLVFANSTRSYRDLPLRFSEFGLVHRHELSGVLSGMFRVRAFTQDDAHLFVSEEQIETEVIGVIEMIKMVLRTFDFEFSAELSTRPQKFMGEKEVWDRAEKSLENALKTADITYEINAGDGAFYGPKIDFKVKDAIGRIWQLSTCQLDFQMPMRFGVKYEGADGAPHTPVVIHRAIYGSLDRFIGILIEHYAGKFPIWISPVQIALLAINDEVAKYTNELGQRMRESGLRVMTNLRAETINAKIRDAQMQKIPYMLVIGSKEMAGEKLQIRQRDGKQFSMDEKEFITHVHEMIDKKKNIE